MKIFNINNILISSDFYTEYFLQLILILNYNLLFFKFNF